jgi:hypothetical protein
MRNHRQQRSIGQTTTDALIGAAGGLVGTAAIWLAQSATRKWVPQATEPMRLEPGEFIVHRAHKVMPASTWKYLPHTAEKASAMGLSFCYGATFGALYGALRPRGGSPWLDGTVLGILCWAAGYLGWLPATGLMPPIWKHKPAQIAGPVVQHAIYGAAAVGAYDLIKEHV